MLSTTLTSAARPASATVRRAMSTAAPLLVSPAELRKLRDSGVSVLDASWHMPNVPRKAREEFMSKRIPGAHFLDLDEVASPNDLGLKHMMPSGRVFADACEKFGITRSSRVVIYDSYGIFSSPRALFMFRAFGHENSSVLNGGLPGWEAEGFETDSGPLKEQPKSEYPIPSLSEGVIRSYEQIVANSELQPSGHGNAELVLDARPRGRWLGTDPEPRPGMSSGHIPQSFSLPFNTLVKPNSIPGTDKTYTTFRQPSEVEDAVTDVLGLEFIRQAIAGERQVVTSCGSGMTAGVLWLGLKMLDAKKVALYDESWTGYASRESSVIEKAL